MKSWLSIVRFLGQSDALLYPSSTDADTLEVLQFVFGFS